MPALKELKSSRGGRARRGMDQREREIQIALLSLHNEYMIASISG